jgi:hypothetical protein
VQFRSYNWKSNSVVSFYFDMLEKDMPSLSRIESDDEFLARQTKNDSIVKVLSGNFDLM